MIEAILPSLASLIGKTLDRVIPDEAERERLKATVLADIMANGQQELRAAADIITAEAKGESWLQRNWRPLLMLWFAALVGAHWLGLTPVNLSNEIVSDLLAIVQVGVGGYVVGRSIEKTARIWKGDNPKLQ